MNRHEPAGQPAPDALTIAAWHALAWLVTANAVGCLLAALQLFPLLNDWLGEWSYGRWIPVHLNLQLYGWCSLPLVAWLLKVFQADRLPASRWSRSALWAWSAALIVGALSWLNGDSSGKVFLEWQGFARVLFPMAAFVLWLVLLWSLRCHWNSEDNRHAAGRFAKLFGLALLLLVPPVLYWAANPKIYPPVNPDTGGPTGASLLESTLGIVVILLLLPSGFGRRPKPGRYPVFLAWAWLVLGIGLSLSLGRGNDSHHRPDQILGLGSLMPWMFLLPAYYNSFEWPVGTALWRWACFAWWGLLLTSAWLMFFPGLLDRFKFTDALVGHSHLAMAGFISSLNIFLLMTLLERDNAIFSSKWAFGAWQAGTLGYVFVMWVAGWLEGGSPAFTIVPGLGRDALYLLRLGCGGAMTAASWNWLVRASRRAPGRTNLTRCQAAARNEAVPMAEHVS